MNKTWPKWLLDCVKQAYSEGWSPEQIGEVIQRSAPQVRYILSREGVYITKAAKAARRRAELIKTTEGF